MKTIDAIRKGTPEIPGYADSVAVIENGNELYNDGFSTEPNPYQPSTMKPWQDVYVRIAEGQYGWVFLNNHKKYGQCILINGGLLVPTINPNPNHNKAYYAIEIFIHCGESETWRGSRGGLTVPPSKAAEFFGLFNNNEIGKLIIRKAVL